MAPVLGRREPGRALLARQRRLERADATAEEAVTWLVGMQAQAPYAPYFGLWSRLRKFGTPDLADALTERRLVRVALMRGTVHLVTAADYRSLRPWAQTALDRELDTAFKTTPDRSGPCGRGGIRPGAARRTAPHRGGAAPAVARSRAPRARHRRSAEPGAAGAGAATRRLGCRRHHPVRDGGRLDQSRARPRVDSEHVVLRYLAAFGPASVTDVQTWAGRTRLRQLVGLAMSLNQSVHLLSDESAPQRVRRAMRAAVGISAERASTDTHVAAPDERRP